MRSIKMFLAGLALLLVAACGGNGSNLVPSTPAQTVFGLNSGYSVLLDAAKRYNNLPRCESGKQEVAACSDKTVVQQLRDFNNNAQPQLELAEQYARNGVTGQVMVDAINALKAVLVGYKNIVYKTSISIPADQKAVVDSNIN